MQNQAQTHKRPRIVFLVMSAVTSAATVDQLAQALAPHTVLVHHDFSQVPGFTLQSDNVIFVPDPVKTGWASFGFVDGIFHSLRYATRELQFDYLQLLSPTCLPIRPLPEFEAQVAGPEEAHFGAIDMLRDTECQMGVGYRAFTPEKSLRHRVLRRLTSIYFGHTPGRRDEAGVWLRTGGSAGWLGLAARAVYGAFTRPWLGRHPFNAGFRPHYGSVWFGAQRHIVQGMVQGYFKPGVRDYFSRLRISEEFLIPSLLMRLVQRKGRLNHFINRFDEAHPLEIKVGDLEMLRESRAYFARKFPDDPASPLRLQVLTDLAGRSFEIPAAGVELALSEPSRDFAPAAPFPAVSSSPRATAPTLTTLARAMSVARSGLHAGLAAPRARNDRIAGP